MDLAKIKPDETLDVRGISCPMPTLKTQAGQKIRARMAGLFR
jgi:TusA-related sulfurtransferase